MEWTDVKRTVAAAVQKSGLRKGQTPKLLSDNGPGYVAKDLKKHLDKNFGIKQIHGAPMHPQTQGKIERYHRSMKSFVKLHHYFCPSELETAIEKYVDYYNNHRYHESLQNLKPADVYFGRGNRILKKRAEIKKKALKLRKTTFMKKYLSKFAHKETRTLHR